MAAGSIHSIYNWDFIYDQAWDSRSTGSSFPPKDETAGIGTIKLFHTFCMGIFGNNGQGGMGTSNYSFGLRFLFATLEF